MNEKLKELAKQAHDDVITKTPSFLVTKEMINVRFAELILQAASDYIMESSDRHRKEYFAEKVLKTFDGEYEIGTMEGLKEFEDKRNGNGS